MVFFGWIFDTLTPLASQFCQSRPWSTMPRRVIWMQNKNLSIPPYVWHLKAIFIWTLNLLNLQLQILRYALYLISAIKKVEIFEEIVSTTVDLKKFFLLENKINKTIHFSQNQRENDTQPKSHSTMASIGGTDFYMYIRIYQYIIPLKIHVWDFLG